MHTTITCSSFTNFTNIKVPVYITAFSADLIEIHFVYITFGRLLMIYS